MQTVNPKQILGKSIGKFTSVSTSLLLACLTSSFAATTVADNPNAFKNTENTVSEAKKEESSQEQQDKHKNIQVLDGFSKIEPSGEQAFSQGKLSNVDVSIKVDHANSQDAIHQQEQVKNESNSLNNSDLSKQNLPFEASKVLSSNATQEHSANTEQSQAIAMVTSSHKIMLDQDNSVYVSFEHPKELKESFILAGKASVLTYSNEQGSFLITYRIAPLAETQQPSFDEFKQLITHRFSDKANMLYGEYDLIQTTNKESLYDITLSGFLKKPSDGILPDMQNHFLERHILAEGTRASLSCEFRGTQAQATQNKELFKLFTPLCDRILQSYKFNRVNSINYQ